jgi:hypothetical protein
VTIRKHLHRLIDELDEQSAAEALDYLLWLRQPDDQLTDAELAAVRAGEFEIERGEWVGLDELHRQLRA